MSDLEVNTVQITLLQLYVNKVHLCHLIFSGSYKGKPPNVVGVDS